MTWLRVMRRWSTCWNLGRTQPSPINSQDVSVLLTLCKFSMRTLNDTNVYPPLQLAIPSPLLQRAHLSLAPSPCTTISLQHLARPERAPRRLISPLVRAVVKVCSCCESCSVRSRMLFSACVRSGRARSPISKRSEYSSATATLFSNTSVSQ